MAKLPPKAPAKSTAPDISVIIPVKNEAAGLAACLQGILDQTVPVREIIVIDSGSTDGTQDIVKSFPKTVLIEIPPSEFNHGATRNLGVSKAKGELIVFTVGDARPMASDWIEQLLKGLTSPDIVAVGGAQSAPPEKRTNPVEWFQQRSTPAVTVYRFESPEAFARADPKTRWQATSLDDVTALYRRSVLLEIPFRKIVYGEDVFFALDALNKGYALAFNPAARVFHYHLENYQTILKRTIAVASLRYQMTGYETPPHAFGRAFLRAVALLMRNNKLTWSERFKWIRYNYDLGRAIRDGLIMVRQATAKGGEALQALHEQYCGTPPIPLKASST